MVVIPIKPLKVVRLHYLFSQGQMYGDDEPVTAERPETQ